MKRGQVAVRGGHTKGFVIVMPRSDVIVYCGRFVRDGRSVVTGLYGLLRAFVQGKAIKHVVSRELRGQGVFALLVGMGV